MTDHPKSSIARCVAASVLAVLLVACAPLETKAPSESTLTPAEINVQLGLRHWRNNQPQLALDKIVAALEQDPTLASAHNVAGLIYDRLGEPALAERHFTRALELDPDDPSARNNYGMFLCNQGHLAQAEKNFLTAADNPDNPSPDVAYTNAGLCARRIPDLDRAAQYFTAALNSNPVMPAAQFQIARISYEKGRYSEAWRDLQHYLQVGEHTAETLWLAVQIERALGNIEQERRYARQLQTQFPQSEETQALLASELRPGYERISPTPTVSTTDAGTVTVTASTGHEFKREDWVRAQDPQRYTVQLFASQNERAMPYFRDQYELSGEMAYFALRRGSATWYALIWGEFDDRRQAENAISQLPEVLRGTARIRQFGAIQQDLLAQAVR